MGKFQLGDYVLVNSKPDDWESGASTEAQRTLVGHVGIVVEVNGFGDDTFMCLVRFPHVDKEHATAQSNIEVEALTLVGRPTAPISPEHYIACGAPGVKNVDPEEDDFPDAPLVTCVIESKRGAGKYRVSPLPATPEVPKHRYEVYGEEQWDSGGPSNLGLIFHHRRDAMTSFSRLVRYGLKESIKLP